MMASLGLGSLAHPAAFRKIASRLASGSRALLISSLSFGLGLGLGLGAKRSLSERSPNAERSLNLSSSLCCQSAGLWSVDSGPLEALHLAHSGCKLSIPSPPPW